MGEEEGREESKGVKNEGEKKNKGNKKEKKEGGRVWMI